MTLMHTLIIFLPKKSGRFFFIFPLLLTFFFLAAFFQTLSQVAFTVSFFLCPRPQFPSFPFLLTPSQNPSAAPSFFLFWSTTGPADLSLMKPLLFQELGG